MSLTQRVVAVAIAIHTIVVPTRAQAQNAVVYYDHKPGDKVADRVTFIRPGERVSKENPERHLGEPPLLRVSEGSQACYVIENANPLLYNYSSASKTVTVEAPSGLAEVLKTLGQAMTYFGQGGQDDAASVAVDAKPYAEGIKELADTAGEIEALKASSDDSTSLSPVFTREAELFRTASQQNESLDKVYETNKVDIVFQRLREAQMSAWNRIQGLDKEFRAAKGVGTPRFCVTLADARLRVALLATPKQKPKEGQKSARPVDTLTVFLTEPVLTKDFEVIPAAIGTFAVGGARDFDVSGNAVVASDDDGPNIRPGVLLVSRLVGPLSASLGTSTSRGKAPDFHLGLLVRTGLPGIGTSLLIGAGLGLAHVPVDLDGATVGSPVPEGRRLQDLITYDYRAGVGFYFTVSGLAVGGSSDKPVAAEPGAK